MHATAVLEHCLVALPYTTAVLNLVVLGEVNQSGRPESLAMALPVVDVDVGELPGWSRATFRKYAGGFEAGLARAQCGAAKM